MKKQIRLRSLLIVVTTALLSMFSCQKDDLVDIEDSATANKRTIIKHVSAKDIPVLQNFIATKMNGLPQKSAGNGSYVETPFGEIPLENVTEVLDQEGYKNYTFKIHPKNPKANILYNLVVAPTSDGDEFTAYVLEYIMGDTFATQLFFREKYMGEFEGEVNKYPLEIFLNKNFSKTSELPCPCAEITPVSGGFGGFGGGSGSGTGDSGDTDDSGDGTNSNPSGNGTATGGTNAGGGGCKIRLVIECSGGDRDLPPYWPQGAVCVTTGIFIDCPASKSNISKTGDCDISNEGSCPDTDGTFGVVSSDLADFLELSGNDRRILTFEPNQDIADATGSFLWKFKDNEALLANAKEVANAIVDSWLDDTMTKEQAIATLESEDLYYSITVQIEDKCQKQIVEDAIKTDSPLGEVVKRLFDVEVDGNGRDFDLIVSQADLDGANAETKPVNCVGNSCHIPVKLDLTYLGRATDLAIARTVIHESVHATLLYLLEKNHITASDPDADLGLLAVLYANWRAANDDAIVSQVFEERQHIAMTELVDDMATALQAYGQSLGYNLSFSYCRKLTWSSRSLRETTNFTRTFPNASDRTDIETIGLAESFNQTLGNHNGTSNINPQGIPANERENCN